MEHKISYTDFENIVNKYDRDYIDKLLEILGEDISPLSYEQMLEYLFNCYLDKFDLSEQDLTLKCF